MGRASKLLGKLTSLNGAGCVVMLIAAAVVLPGQTFTNLHGFGGTDGGYPYAGLVQGIDGNLYGTTSGDGCTALCGTVFKITPTGAFSTLYTFCSQTGCPDGESPSTSLVLAPNGDFYGATATGGANGGGTIFEITPNGVLTTIYSFCALPDCADGGYPSTLIQGTDGNLYGTSGSGMNNGGTVFKVTPKGAFAALYNFCSKKTKGGVCLDGEYPSGVVQAFNGYLYGTTRFGGSASSDCYPNGCGTVFALSPSGKLTTLHRFCTETGCPDGDDPASGLIQVSNGSLYGTTFAGGANTCGLGGCGTVFMIAPTGELATLYSFCSEANCADGYDPSALTLGTGNSLYGVTWNGGAAAEGNGTVFEIPPSGVLTTIYDFTNLVSMPNPLFLGTDGSLFGTSYFGDGGGGNVFSLSIGLPPFVIAQKTSGEVGATIELLGTDLTGTTAVAFHGVPAGFEVVSGTLISTRVPEGATSRTIQVVTPSGTLLSNVPFHVTQ